MGIRSDDIHYCHRCSTAPIAIEENGWFRFSCNLCSLVASDPKRMPYTANGTESKISYRRAIIAWNKHFGKKQK